jgi:hypothetical protein
MNIVITLAMFKWAGLPLFILTALCIFFSHDVFDNWIESCNNFWDYLRWLVWPLFIFWLAVILIRGLIY